MPSSVTLGTTRGVELTLLGVGLLPCGVLGRLRLCGVIRGGVAQGRAAGTDQPAPEGSPFVLVAARPGVLFPIGSLLALSADLEVGATLARTQLIIDGRAVWTAPPVSAGAALGVVFMFGDGS